MKIFLILLVLTGCIGFSSANLRNLGAIVSDAPKRIEGETIVYITPPLNQSDPQSIAVQVPPPPLGPFEEDVVPPTVVAEPVQEPEQPVVTNSPPTLEVESETEPVTVSQSESEHKHECKQVVVQSTTAPSGEHKHEPVVTAQP